MKTSSHGDCTRGASGSPYVPGVYFGLAFLQSGGNKRGMIEHGRTDSDGLILSCRQEQRKTERRKRRQGMKNTENLGMTTTMHHGDDDDEDDK